MSTSKIVTVWCDEPECHAWSNGPTGPHPRIKDVRADCRRSGWVYRDGRDTCPCCAGTCRAMYCDRGCDSPVDNSTA